MLKWNLFFRWNYVPFMTVVSGLLMRESKGWNFSSHCMPYTSKIAIHLLPVLVCFSLTGSSQWTFALSNFAFWGREIDFPYLHLWTFWVRSSFLFPLHGRCSVKQALQDKKLLPLGHEKEQIYVKAAFLYFARKEPVLIINHQKTDKKYIIQMGNKVES